MYVTKYAKPYDFYERYWIDFSVHREGRRYQYYNHHIPEWPLKFSVSVLKIASHNEAVNPVHLPMHIYEKLGDSTRLNGIHPGLSRP